jgi:hypothetical protein
MVMGHKGGPGTKKNWPTDRRSQNQHQLQLFGIKNGGDMFFRNVGSIRTATRGYFQENISFHDY